MLLPVQVGHHIHIFNAGCSKTTTVSKQLYTTQIFCYGWIPRVCHSKFNYSIKLFLWMDTKSFPMNGSNFTQLKYLCYDSFTVSNFTQYLFLWMDQSNFTRSKYLCYDWIPRVCLRINEPSPLFVNARCETGGDAEHEDDF